MRRDRSASATARVALLAGAVLAALAPGAAAAWLGELVPIPEVALGGFEPAVRAQLQEQRALVEEKVRSAPVDPEQLDERNRREIGRAFGGLGELYLVYDLAAPARAALQNAARLDASNHRWSYLLGTLLQLERDFAGAEAQFRASLELRPEYVAAVLRLGDVLFEQGRHAEAGEQYAAALELARYAPGYTGAARYGLGRVALATGDPTRAIEHFEGVLELQPNAGQARYQLALAHRDRGERDLARELLAQPRERFEGDVRFPDPVAFELQQRAQGVGALLALGRIALGEGELAVAEERFRKAVEQDPESAAAQRSLASVLQQLGREQEAIEAYETAVRLEPDAAGLRAFLAGLYGDRVRARFAKAGLGDAAGSYDLDELPAEEREAARRELERAAEHLSAALEQAPDFVSGWVDLAGTSVGLGRRGDAIEQLARALALRPEATDLRLFRARLLAADGRTAEAIAEYDRTAAGAAATVASASLLEAARVLGDAGELAAARARYETLAARDPAEAPDPVRAAALLHLGNLDLEEGRTAAAMERYRAALDIDPGLVEARFNLATALGRAGRYGEASAEHARVVEQKPDYHEARFGEAMALVLAGDYRRAVERLEEALELYPSGAAYAHLLARVLVAAPDDGVRDGEVGLDLAARLFDALPTPEHAETLAMAFAEVGRFADAVAWQERVVQELEKAGRSDLLAPARARLESYRAGHPARAPWLD